MAGFFPEKTTRFSSLLCLVILTVLLIAFFLAVPQLFIGPAGEVFIALWGGLAGLIFIAHARRAFSRPASGGRKQLAIGPGYLAKPGEKPLAQKLRGPR